MRAYCTIFGFPASIIQLHRTAATTRTTYSSRRLLGKEERKEPTVTVSRKNSYHANMPSQKQTHYDTSLPEVHGLVYDESEMALFHAKLSYHSTVDERMASQDTNLASICEHQARILKRWEMLKQVEKEMADKGKNLSPAEKKQLAQYEWRYKRLEELATQTTGG